MTMDLQMKYKTWLWWTRFAMVITLLQFLGATYLMFRVSTFVSPDGMPRHCVLGKTYTKFTFEFFVLILDLKSLW